MESIDTKRQKPSIHSRQLISKPLSSSVSNNKRIVSTKGKSVTEYKNEEYQRSERNKRLDADRKIRLSSSSSREPYKSQPENLVYGKGILKEGPSLLHQMVLRELGLKLIDVQADPASLQRKRGTLRSMALTTRQEAVLLLNRATTLRMRRKEGKKM